MKMKNLLAATVIVSLGFLSSLNAQITAPTPLVYESKSVSSVDTVTIGSVMPYQVTGDLNFHALRRQGLFDFSNFNWSLTGGTAGTNYELRDKTGNASTTPAAKDTVIGVQWITTGSYQVNVQESPVPASGMPAISCTGSTENLNVLVVARPVLTWPTPANTGGCNVAGTTVNIPVNVAGTGQYEITYKIDYTNLSGTTTTKVASGTKVTLGNYKPGAQTLNLTYAIPAGEYGTYNVTIENLSDRISRKSGVATLAADRPSTTFKIYSYPAPATQPIQHIKNL